MNKSILKVLSWKESPIEGFSEQNSVNIAKAEFEVSGYLNGKMTSTYVIHYTIYDVGSPHEVESTFTGYSLFEGMINGKNGRIVFVENGKHQNGLVSNLHIKQFTGEFEALQGSGEYVLEGRELILTTVF